MTDEELLQQALDVMEDLGIKEAQIVSEAIKARLAQPEPTIDGWPLYSGLPKPEPVAWQVKFRDDDGIPQIAWFPHPVHPESNLAKRPYIEEPLYTAPPKKEWVGLTDDEYESMAEQYVTNCYFDTLEYAKAIEAKLKEKNT